MLSFLLAITDESQRDKIEYRFKNFHKDMLGYASVYLRQASPNIHKADIEDVVENAFIRLTKYASGINPNAEKEELRAYVLTIVINECKRFIERKNDVVSLDDSYFPDDDDFIERLCIKERYEMVVSAIKTLDPIYSTVLFLRFFKEKTVAEIASELDVPEKTVYTRIKRAREILIKVVEDRTASPL